MGNTFFSVSAFLGLKSRPHAGQNHTGTATGNVLRLAVADMTSLDGIAYDVMYYRYDAGTGTGEWLMFANVVPVQAENGLLLELGFEPNAGDGIYIRAKKNGKAIGTYTPYVLVSSN